MYALRPFLKQRQTPNLLTLGEHMKKILLALLLGFAGIASAAPTDTPTVTLTPTPTFTPTPTRTNTPVNSIDGQKGHIYIQAPQFTLSDGVTRPVTTPVAGSTSIWLAQTLSATCAVFSTNTASARIQFTVPADYMRGGSLWLHGYDSVTYSTTVVIQADLSRMSIGSLTSTANVYVGLTQNVQTQFTGRLNNARYSRTWIPLSGTVGTSGTLKPGDMINVLIQRSGAVGDLNVFAADFEYAVNYPYRP